MQIKIPRRVVDAWDRFVDWANEPAITFKNYPRGILRLDIINFSGFVLTCVYFYWSGGFWMMIAGILSYILVAMTCLWFL